MFQIILTYAKFGEILAGKNRIFQKIFKKSQKYPDSGRKSRQTQNIQVRIHKIWSFSTGEKQKIWITPWETQKMIPFICFSRVHLVPRFTCYNMITIRKSQTWSKGHKILVSSVLCNFFLFRLFGLRGGSTQSSSGLKSTKPIADAPTRVGPKTVEYSIRTPITNLREMLFSLVLKSTKPLAEVLTRVGPKTVEYQNSNY